MSFGLIYRSPALSGQGGSKRHGAHGNERKKGPYSDRAVRARKARGTYVPPGSPALLAVSRILLPIAGLLAVTGVLLLVVARVRLLVPLRIALLLVRGVRVLRLRTRGVL